MATPGRAVRVLHVDDEPDFADLTAAFIAREEARFTVDTALSASRGLDRLEDDHYDCVVSDYDMPGENGLDFLRSVREHHPELPFILFTGKGSEEIASEAISAGVTDYLQKGGGSDQYALLANRIRNAVERWWATREAERTRSRLEAITANSADAIVTIDTRSEIVYANSAVEELFGYDPDALVGESLTTLMPPRHRAEHLDAVARYLETGQRTLDWHDIEFSALHRDGHEIPISVSFGAFEEGGEPRFVGIIRDITEREARGAEFTRLRDMFDATERIADVGGWEIDTRSREVHWSPHLFEMLGRDDDEAPPLEAALDVYVEEDRPAVEDAVETALASGEPFDVNARFERTDGEIRWFRILGEPIVEDGEVLTVRGAVQDITDHKRRERELEQARAEYEELFNGMNDTAWVIGPDERFLAVNDAAVERTGYTRAELRSMGPADIDASLADEELSTLIDEMPDDELQIFETSHRTSDGTEIPVEICSTLITYEGERAILSIGRDISDRKQREEQLEQFAAVVSHDLRNPLAIAEGHLELARETCDSDHLDQVATAHDRMSTLIDDLLTLAREGDEIGALETIDLADHVTTCWQTVDSDGATLEVSVTGQIRADESRLRQLLENLLRNAVEHGSTSSRPEAGDAVEHGSTSNRTGSGDAVEHGAEDVTVTVGELEDGFYLEDDGPGIAADRREAVLDVGHSSSDSGRGFGLQIVRQIVEAHGWSIHVTEGVEGGARFEITGVESAEG